MRRAARIDTTHPAIVEALRDVGAGVTNLAGVGQGVADLLVSYRGHWHLLECKRARGPKGGGGGSMTPAQLDWIQAQRAIVAIVRSPEEALEAIGAKARRPTDGR